jgi:uncharacterized damage-inducible protein DinB
MNELARALTGDSAATPAAHILEGITEELAHRGLPPAPHTIYQELWHIAFWQQLTLDWIRGIETAYPARPSLGFPEENNRESWEALRSRFLQTLAEAETAATNVPGLDQQIRCPSRPGQPVRVMTIREQLESLASHNAYHLGRLVLLRQLQHAWPPPSGGFGW